MLKIHTLERIWRKYISWRPQYYKKVYISQRYLENYRDIIDKTDELKNLRFKKRYTFSIADKDTAVITFQDIFVNQCYRISDPAHKEVIVDIGANIGLFSLYALFKAPQAKIFAIEANPFTFQILKKNVEENLLMGKIEVHNLAIYSKQEKVKIFCHKISGWSSLFNVGNLQKGAIQNIEAMPLSMFCKHHGIKKIDYLKMDCEDAEYDIVLRDANFFNIPIMEISMEVNKSPVNAQGCFSDLIGCLCSHYRSVSIRGKGQFVIVSCRRLKSSE